MRVFPKAVRELFQMLKKRQVVFYVRIGREYQVEIDGNTMLEFLEAARCHRPEVMTERWLDSVLSLLKKTSTPPPLPEPEGEVIDADYSFNPVAP